MGLVCAMLVRKQMHIEFLCGNQKERDLLEVLGFSERGTLKLIFKKDMKLWTGYIWFRTGARERPL
jgi:hypothetical protein